MVGIDFVSVPEGIKAYPFVVKLKDDPQTSLAGKLYPAANSFMHISIRHFKSVTNAKEATRAVNEKFYPLIQAIPGFVVYYGMETSDNGWASINVFETEEGAAESNKVGVAFARDNNLFQVEPEIIAGSLIAITAADNVHEIMTEFRKSIA